MATQTYTNGVTLTDAAEFNKFDQTAYATLFSVTGTNTLTATGPASYSAYSSTGPVFTLIPPFTNTSTVTLNVTPFGGSALGAKNVYLNGQPLAGGEMVSTVPLALQFDGTQLNIIANAYKRLKLAPSGAAKNIAARTNSVTPNTKIDITADELILTNSTGNAIRVTSVSGTIDFGTVGANGLDASTQASSTWYYGWVIAKEDGTVAVLGSLSSSAPTMPAGYTFKALVTAARSDGSTHFIQYRQAGMLVEYETPQSVLSGGSASTETAITITSAIPPNALTFLANLYGSLTGGAGGNYNSSVILRIITGKSAFQVNGANAASTQTGFGAQVNLINISQTLFYLFTPTTNVSATSINVDIAGFKLPGGGE